MDSTEREILSLLGSVSTFFTFGVALAVLALGLVLVRPLNKVAGLVFAGAGGGRIVGVGLDVILNALRPNDGGMDTIMVLNAIGSLIWVINALVFYGGVMFGLIKLAETPTQRGTW